MSVWKRRLIVAVALAVIAGWLFFGHRLAAQSVREELSASLGLETEIGFVLLGPDLNLYAYDVRLRAKGVAARVPWAKFVIPFSRLWGSGSTRAIRFRNLSAVVDEEADLSFLTEGKGRGEGGAEGEGRGAGEPLQEISGSNIDIRVRDLSTGTEVPLLVTRHATALRSDAGDYRVEVGSGACGELPFDSAAMRIVSAHDHLLVTDFKLHAFDGIVGGLLDLHLKSAGSFNGELEWHLLDVHRICLHYGVQHADDRHGRVGGSIRFHAGGPSLRQLKGSGEVRLEQARFWSPVNFKVFLVLGIPALEESWIRAAESVMTVEDGLVYLERGSIRSADFKLDVVGLGEIGGACDLEVSYRGTTVAVRGNLKDPDVKVLPFDAVTLPFDRMFRTRVRERGR